MKKAGNGDKREEIDKKRGKRINVNRRENAGNEKKTRRRWKRKKMMD